MLENNGYNSYHIMVEALMQIRNLHRADGSREIAEAALQKVSSMKPKQDIKVVKEFLDEEAPLLHECDVTLTYEVSKERRRLHGLLY